MFSNCYITLDDSRFRLRSNEKASFQKGRDSGIQSIRKSTYTGGETGANPKNEEKLDGPTNARKVKDGKYEGITDKDERGNYGIAKITVKDGKITEAEYTEYTEDNKPKTKESGYDYQQALDAFEKLPDILIETQDLNKIDTYAGATGTTKTFKIAVMKALEKGIKEE